MSKISVLMSLYDKESEDFLDSCLESILNQTRIPDQVVIVIDGHVRENLHRIIDRYSDKLPIEKLALENNSGLAIALNSGLDICTGDLIARMDTDDICMPDRIEKQERFILKEDLDIVGSGASVIDYNGNTTGTRMNPLKHEDIVSNLWRNPFIHPSVMFKKNKIKNIGSYDDSLRRRQDYELWFRAANNGLKFGNLQEELISYRFDEHTLRKQSPKLAWIQGTIGFKGSLSCNLGFFRSIVCFIPFFRSLFPIGFQIKLTRFMKLIDSSLKTYNS